MNILDLPENDFRNILYYIENEEVYFVVRNVCRIFRKHSEKYVQLHSKFLFVASISLGRHIVLPDVIHYCILYIFRMSNNTKTIYWQKFHPIPDVYIDRNQFDIQMFEESKL